MMQPANINPLPCKHCGHYPHMVFETVSEQMKKAHSVNGTWGSLQCVNPDCPVKPKSDSYTIIENVFEDWNQNHA